MLTYRATLRPRSATLSPWQADTLFGHLCWLIRYDEGEAALDDFLAHFRRGAPTLLFSDGFPADQLPRPLLPSPPLAMSRAKAAQVQAMQAAKEIKGIRWVGLDDFNRLRRGESVSLQRPSRMTEHRTVLKNQINRLTGGTTPQDEAAEGGNLYSVDELAFVDTSGVTPSGFDVIVYVRAETEEWAGRARGWLERLARSGYGAKKSAGYGHFALTDWQQFTGFDESLSDANGFVSLSNWLPGRDDPTDGFYGTMVKYGKLGEELASSENPFKFPLIMLTAGSSFYTDTPIREWYGRLVAGVAPADVRVVHYGYAFAVPARLASGE